MCDYSLQNVASRPARTGDRLISTSFPQTSTRGFASIDDRRVAVCLLPGTELSFEKEVKFNSGGMFPRKVEHQVAKFNKINAASSYHHDALEFPDGRIVLVTDLCIGQHATVLQLPVGLSFTAGNSKPQEATPPAPAVPAHVG